MNTSTGQMRLALILGLLGAVGPFAIDMYLPALPGVAADLGAQVTTAQYSVIAFFLTFGAGQIVYGPLSDHAGRKLALYCGLAVFIAASAGCALSSSIEMLIGLRMLQGFGAAVAMVIPRAIIRDLLTGTAATRLMARLMLVISVSPMLAPLAGSFLIGYGGWRIIFLFLTLAGAASFLVTIFVLPETLPSEKRVAFNAASFVRGSAGLLADRQFMLLTLVNGFGFATFFIFLANASFVYTEQYGLTPTGFSLAFAANAAGFFAASQFAGMLGDRYGMYPMVAFSVLGFATATVVLAILVFSGFDSLFVLIAGLVVANGFLGLVIPSTMVMALDRLGHIAGLASSLGGTLQMLTGVLVSAIAGLFFDATAGPMVAAIAASALITLVLSRFVGAGTEPDAPGAVGLG